MQIKALPSSGKTCFEENQLIICFHASKILSIGFTAPLNKKSKIAEEQKNQ